MVSLLVRCWSLVAVVLFASTTRAQSTDDERHERVRCVTQAFSAAVAFPLHCRNNDTVKEPPRCKGPTCVVDVESCCHSGRPIYATWLRGPDGAIVEIAEANLMAPVAVAFDASGHFVRDDTSHRWMPPSPEASASSAAPSDTQQQQAIGACRRHAPTCAKAYTSVTGGNCGHKGCFLVVKDGEEKGGAFCTVWVPRRGPAQVVSAGDDAEPPSSMAFVPPDQLTIEWPDSKGLVSNEKFFTFGGPLRRAAVGGEVPVVDVDTWQQVLQRERRTIVPTETNGITSMVSGAMPWSGNGDVDMLVRTAVGDDVFAFEAMLADNVIVFPGANVAAVDADHLELLTGKGLLAFVPRDARRVDVERWRTADGVEVREPLPGASCMIRAARATDDTAPQQALQTVRVLACVVPRALLGIDPTKEAISLRISDGDGAGQKTLSAVAIGPLRPTAIFPPVAALPATGTCRPR